MKEAAQMSMVATRIYTLLFLVSITLAFTISMEPLFRIGLVVLGLLAIKHIATEETS
jgi:hypothetical protein